MRGSSTRRTYTLILAIIMLLIFLHSIGALVFAERLTRGILTSFLTTITETRIKLGDNWDYLLNRNAALSSAERFREDRQKLGVLSAENKLLSTENQLLKKQLDFKSKIKSRLIVAEVIGREVTGGDNFILINKGGTDGVLVGQPVVTDAGVLVGKIISLRPDVAYFRLISDNQSKVAATILNKDGSLGVVEGGYGISLLMQFIPRNETILVGDQVVSSGLEGGVPRGILIGSVAVVENEAYKPFQQAILTPAADLSKLTIVGVIVP